jgi:ATP-dependent Lhr-like helicase
VAALASAAGAAAYRLNIGTIVEEEMLKVRIAKVRTVLGKRVATGGFVLGELEEWFLSAACGRGHLLFSGRSCA